jgi:pimeloyl-ACP methyl ester carboxylesterase
VTEAVLDWDAGRTWYRVVGDLSDDTLAPLVLLHGGPGAAHDYLEPLAVIANSPASIALRRRQPWSRRS